MPTFRISIIKEFEGWKWDNAYHLDAPDLVTAAAFALDIASFEARFHTSIVHFIEAVTANELDPSRLGFISQALDYYGGIPHSDTEVEPASICLWCTLVTATGHPGKKFYRLALVKANTICTGSGASLVGTYYQDAVAASWSTLSAELGGTAGLLAGKFHNKPVSSINAHGVAAVKTNHKYFDTRRPG
jgi:hypothetical protein